MTAVHIIVGAVVGCLVAAIAGFVLVVASGGVKAGEGDPREWIVSVLLMVGIATGAVVGWLA